MNVRRRLLGFSGVLLAVAFTWGSRGQSSQETLPAPAAPQRRAQAVKFELQGAGSCAAQACHNADALTGGRREYHIALERDFTGVSPRVKDKHAQAYEVLFDERSHRILRHWKGLAATSAVHPEREALCLRCHVHPGFDRHPLRVVDGVTQFRLEDGVSCEACHGPAEHWLAAHFRPGWKALSAQQRAEFGMSDTRSVAGRVQLCMDCHVGRPDAQVDHDLIAAGHPWLRFEFGDYHAKWHKHWEIAKDKDSSVDPRARRDFEARAWLVGQVASAQTALDLLASRARDGKRPWPEFAEQDCFACHHDLREPNQRLPRPGKAGMPIWNAWYTAMAPVAVGADGVANELERSLVELRRLMAAWQPPRAPVAAHAEQASAQLERWLTQWGEREPSQVNVEMLSRRLFDIPSAPVAADWIRAAQWQRAFAAIERTRIDHHLPPAPWSGALSELEKALRLPAGFDSPRGYDAQRVLSLIKAMHR